MKKKKWLYVIGIIAIVGSILFLYTSFNGNPLSKWKAKQVALDYLNEVYEENEFWYHETNFNFKDSSYLIRYSYSDLYSGTVEVGNGLWPTKVLNTYPNHEYYNIDEDLRISEVASKQLEQLLKANFPIHDLHYSISVPTSSGITSENFDLTVRTPFKPSIVIMLTMEERTNEEALAIVKSIRDKMNEEHIYYVDFQVQQDTLVTDTKQPYTQLLHAFEVTKDDIVSLK